MRRQNVYFPLATWYNLQARWEGWLSVWVRMYAPSEHNKIIENTSTQAQVTFHAQKTHKAYTKSFILLIYLFFFTVKHSHWGKLSGPGLCKAPGVNFIVWALYKRNWIELNPGEWKAQWPRPTLTFDFIGPIFLPLAEDLWPQCGLLLWSHGCHKTNSLQPQLFF